ncbi:MAG TPA: N-formylglutamate deformylase [Oceanospirillaceae bacterium]|nr:N-formylglutamate deformylase [Oceanospirillaceae bacterium]
MSDWLAFDLYEGDSPLVISMPHSGLRLTAEVEQGLTEQAKVLPDTDWHIPQLYQMAQDLGATCISANYSRYVIDLNRPFNDESLYSSKTTGLFPDILFADQPVFKTHMTPSADHREACKEHIWQAYHGAIAEQLERVKQQYGYAILLDAHSIASHVPMLFAGQLPDFNWGTNEGKSCPESLLQVAQDSVDMQHFTQVSNGRFKGGYITRHYGQPEQNTYAIQLELSQGAYLQAGSYNLCDVKLATVRPVIQRLLQGLSNWRPA